MASGGGEVSYELSFIFDDFPGQWFIDDLVEYAEYRADGNVDDMIVAFSWASGYDE